MAPQLTEGQKSSVPELDETGEQEKAGWASSAGAASCATLGGLCVLWLALTWMASARDEPAPEAVLVAWRILLLVMPAIGTWLGAIAVFGRRPAPAGERVLGFVGLLLGTGALAVNVVFTALFGLGTGPVD